MINPLKLLRSKKYVNEIEKDVKSMNKSNWRTSVCGVVAALVALSQIWAPPTYQARINATAAALVAVGLIKAKDAAN